MATLPGSMPYERCGFRPLEHVRIALPDGGLVEWVSMEMAIA